MSQFQTIIADLEAKAAKAWEAIEAEGEALVTKLKPVVEDGFASAVSDFGDLACATVINFLRDEFAQLTGEEKHGNVVTTLIQSAESQGKSLAITDAQALAKSAFLAVTGEAL